MATDREIERRYIEEQLDLHGEYLNDLFIADITRKNLINKGDLLDYFDSASTWDITTRNSLPALVFDIPVYGRLIEIQDKKRLRGIRTRKVDTNALLWGIKPKKERKKKGKNAQWYTHNTYGAQNLLIGRLMWGFSDIEKNRIKKLLEENNRITIEVTPM
jgi:hypothetical protein